jgi:hypothetical protein
LHAGEAGADGEAGKPKAHRSSRGGRNRGSRSRQGPPEGGGEAAAEGGGAPEPAGGGGGASDRPGSGQQKAPRTVEVARSSGVDAKGKRVWTVKEQQQQQQGGGSADGVISAPAPAVDGGAPRAQEAA